MKRRTKRMSQAAGALRLQHIDGVIGDRQLRDIGQCS
jgi:hypothetical protein